MQSSQKQLPLKWILTFCLPLSILTCACLMTGCNQAHHAVTQPSIGIYDSRSMVVAFMNCPAYNIHVKPILEQNIAAYNHAKANGDKERMAELQAWGETHQAKLHMQAFSTEPVNEILTYIDKQIVEIAKQAGVKKIVSKWDKQALADYKPSQQIDLTVQMIDAFSPTSRQRKAAINLQKHKPTPGSFSGV